jgi:hypothetical protein
MKPTQEQVLQWARDAGFHRYASDFPDMFEAFATLSYEAGRKDENEACAKVCDSLINTDPEWTDSSYWDQGVERCAEAIRTRREQ